MDGVSDAPFRFITAKYGAPDVIFTEFTAAEGIRAGALRLLDDFLYNPIERPVVAQLFGADPEAFYLAALVAAELGFDGVDINMGCPAKNITERGAGASLILDPERAKQIIQRTKDGISDWVGGRSLADTNLPEPLQLAVQARRTEQGLQASERRPIPVSVKTRLGVSDVVITDWVQHLLELQPAAITIHGRTLKQLYSGEADWEAIGTAAAIIHQTDTLALGNGDVRTRAMAEAYAERYGVDGVLIGRAASGNPWVFRNQEVGKTERMAVALEHSRVFHRHFGDHGFVRMRKHLLDYTKGIADAKELRLQLMRVSRLADVEAIL